MDNEETMDNESKTVDGWKSDGKIYTKRSSGSHHTAEVRLLFSNPDPDVVTTVLNQYDTLLSVMGEVG